MTYEQLYYTIAQICPIIEAFVGDPDDPDTWSFTPAQGATPEQIEAAKHLINPNVQPLPVVLARSIPS